jgi:hypothetical protein
METLTLNLLAGWASMLCGLIAGAIIGLFFHREEWMGGYSSFRRRMTRLGHISFFGLGFINIIFALSAQTWVLPEMQAQLASAGFVLGTITMPLCCFLAAWRQPFRHLFPVPVLAVLAGILFLLLGWASG